MYEIPSNLMFPHLLLIWKIYIHIFNNVVSLKLKKYGMFTVLQEGAEKLKAVLS